MNERLRFPNNSSTCLSDPLAPFPPNLPHLEQKQQQPVFRFSLCEGQEVDDSDGTLESVVARAASRDDFIREVLLHCSGSKDQVGSRWWGMGSFQKNVYFPSYKYTCKQTSTGAYIQLCNLFLFLSFFSTFSLYTHMRGEYLRKSY